MRTVFGLVVVILLSSLSSKTEAYISIEELVSCQPYTTWTTSGCIRKQCGPDGKHVNTLECSPYYCPPGAKFELGDPSLPFPKCCNTCEQIYEETPRIIIF